MAHFDWSRCQSVQRPPACAGSLLHSVFSLPLNSQHSVKRGLEIRDCDHKPSTGIVYGCFKPNFQFALVSSPYIHSELQNRPSGFLSSSLMTFEKKQNNTATVASHPVQTMLTTSRRIRLPVPVVHMLGLYVALCQSCSNILTQKKFEPEVWKTGTYRACVQSCRQTRNRYENG